MKMPSHPRLLEELERAVEKTPLTVTPIVVAGRERVVRSPVFVMAMSIVACFVLLLALRPPFVQTPGAKFKKAVVPALLWSLVAGALIIGIPAVCVRPGVKVAVVATPTPGSRR